MKSMSTSSILAGLGIGGATSGAILATEVVISGSTHVPMEAAIGVGVFACGAVFWLGRKFQSIEDNFKANKDEFKRIREILADLHCVRDNHGRCPVEKSSRRDESY